MLASQHDIIRCQNLLQSPVTRITGRGFRAFARLRPGIYLDSPKSDLPALGLQSALLHPRRCGRL